LDSLDREVNLVQMLGITFAKLSVYYFPLFKINSISFCYK